MQLDLCKVGWSRSKRVRGPVIAVSSKPTRADGLLTAIAHQNGRQRSIQGDLMIPILALRWMIRSEVFLRYSTYFQEREFLENLQASNAIKSFS